MGIATLRRHRAAGDPASEQPRKTREELLEESLRVEREKNAALEVQLAEMAKGSTLSPELRAEIQADFERLKDDAERRFGQLMAEGDAIRAELEAAKADLASARADLDAERAKNAAPATDARTPEEPATEPTPEPKKRK